MIDREGDTCIVSADQQEWFNVAENFIDFKILKQQIPIQAVLDHYALGMLRRVNQNSLRGRCPLPTHSSEASNESFSVQTEKNIWACQSDSCSASRNGKRGGNILDFVSIMERCSIRDAALKLRDWFLSPATPPRVVEQGRGATEKLVAEKNQGSGEEGNPPLAFALTGVDSSHEYMTTRGIKKETAEKFGVGFFSGKGLMNGRIVFTINNERGDRIAYAGRTIRDDVEPRWKFPNGFKKSFELYNIHRVRDALDIIIVESFWSVLHLTQHGYWNVVALMGRSLSEQQEKLLMHFGKIALMLDGDQAGREGAAEIAARLVHKKFVRVFDLGDGQQPDQLSADELKTFFIQV